MGDKNGHDLIDWDTFSYEVVPRDHNYAESLKTTNKDKLDLLLAKMEALTPTLNLTLTLTLILNPKDKLDLLLAKMEDLRQ